MIILKYIYNVTLSVIGGFFSYVGFMYVLPFTLNYSLLAAAIVFTMVMASISLSLVQGIFFLIKLISFYPFAHKTRVNRN